METKAEIKKKSLQETMQQGRKLRSTSKEIIWSSAYEECSPLQAQQPKRVGLLYDDKMCLHHCDYDPQHPEHPERVQSIWNKCTQLALVSRCLRITTREASKAEMSLVHGDDYLSFLESVYSMRLNHRKEAASKYDGVYFHRKSYEAIKLAAGSSIELVDHILEFKVKSGFAIIRPPGHHAMQNAACGYCFVNNAALAAKYALTHHRLNRILIVDFDVHHGQGTQYTFYDDGRVLYFSIHRYEHGTFWPNLRESDYDYIGKGKGLGFNINVPLNETGAGDADYIAIFQQILLPVAYEFNPNLVIVSAGYDAAIGDPEGCSNVTPSAYAQLIHMLKPLANGRLAVLLEGGYCIKSLALSAALTLRELLDEPCPSLPPLLAPLESTQESILQTIRVLRPYWSNLTFQNDADDELELPEYFINIEIPKSGVVFDSPENKSESYDVIGDYLLHDKETRLKFDTLIDSMTKEMKLLQIINRTSIVYDERMRLHKCTSSSSHPERPDRITRIYDRHYETGLFQRCLRLPSRVATEEELNLAHEKPYIQEVREYQYKNIEELHSMEHQFNSIYLSQHAYECAALAVGCCLNIVDSVMTGQSSNGVGIVRPPGHHAESTFCMGFCLFNTVAVAAKYAQKKYGLQRILILDWDVHHGNGTQNIFYNDSSVLYISLHRYDDGTFFPMGTDGKYNKVGKDEGEGYNVNIGWNGNGIGDAEYIAAFHQLVMPIAHQFSPELVLVSAGFDAARGDPLGGCRISPEGYAHMTHMISGLAMGRVILLLEGGYNLTAISESMCMCTSVLLGDLVPSLPAYLPPCKSAVASICQTIDTHKKYWTALCYREKMPSKEDTKKWLGDFQTTNSDVKKSDQESENDENAQSVSSEESGEETTDGEIKHLDTGPATNLQDCTNYAHSKQDHSADIKLKIGANQPQSQNDEVENKNMDSSYISEQCKQYVETTDKHGQNENTSNSTQSNESNVVSDSSKKSDMEQGQDSCAQIAPDKIQHTSTADSSKNDKPKDTCVTGQQAHYSDSGTKPLPVDSIQNMVAAHSEGASCSTDEHLGAVGGRPVNVRNGTTAEDVIDFLGAAVEGQNPDDIQMFAVIPKSWCEHLRSVQNVPQRGLHVHDPCLECGNVGENWVCLVCYQVHCSRYVNEHMLMHGIESGHLMVLSFADLTVWCYGCDSYINNKILSSAKRAAHRSKFNEEMIG